MGDLDALLAQGRAAHEALMTDTVRLYRQGEGVFDRDTGQAASGPQTTIYGPGPGRVKPASVRAAEQEQSADREVLLARYEVALPWSAIPQGVDRPLPGDLVEVVTSPDARLVGLTLWVTSSQFSATATAWRIQVEDRSSWGQT
jgi:hypothetical protein